MQSKRFPDMEQASAVRDLFKCAEEAFLLAGELQAECLDHGRNALIFLKAWAEQPDADPTKVRESFARVELLHRLLGGLLDQQRRAAEALPAQLTLVPGADRTREDRARALTLAQLELEGVLGGHRAPGTAPRTRPRVAELNPEDPQLVGLEE